MASERDAAATSSVLVAQGIETAVCSQMADFCRSLNEGGGAGVVVEEALADGGRKLLSDAIAAQPPWSDFPLIIISIHRASVWGEWGVAAFEEFSNATLLERPLRFRTLISAVQVALRSRRRQYEFRSFAENLQRLEREMNELLQREQRIAETLQRSLLGSVTSDAFANLQITTHYVPALSEAMVGGDFFDAYGFGDHAIIEVGDLVGKGIVAASRMAEIKFALRAIVQVHRSPSEILAQLNRYVLTFEPGGTRAEDMIVALTIAVIGLKSGVVSIAQAGSESPVLMRLNRGNRFITGAGGLPIGVDASAQYRSKEIQLEHGDTLIMTTDGITEARRGKEFFGSEGILETVNEITEMASVEDIALRIVHQAQRYALGEFRDDVCLLVARWNAQ
jgi:serine phosphatase RsbU (regulator of sigma subunit)